MKTIVLITIGVVLLLLFNACNKEGPAKSFAYINVKFAENEDYDFMEKVTGRWNFQLKTATMEAAGYKFERFIFSLDLIQDTGIYQNPSIGNIYYIFYHFNG